MAAAASAPADQELLQLVQRLALVPYHREPRSRWPLLVEELAAADAAELVAFSSPALHRPFVQRFEESKLV